MQSLFLTQYIKSNLFINDLREELSERDVNFDFIISDINYNDCPCILINTNTKSQNVSLIDARRDAINIAKHPLVILNELTLKYISPVFDLLASKKQVTIINIHSWLWSYWNKLYPEINDLDISSNWFNCFEPIDLENFWNILKQNWKKYIRLLHREMPSAIFDVDELWIIDAELLKNLDCISLKTYGFAWNDWTILATGSLFDNSIQTWEILQKNNKQLNIFILQSLNCNRNDEIIKSVKHTGKLFILIDHSNTDLLKDNINNKLKEYWLSDIKINIISPNYQSLTTILNEYQEEQALFSPDEIAKRIISML